MQLRLVTALTFDEYLKRQEWKGAKLSACPVCAGPVTSLATYGRKLPRPSRIARFYCRPCHMTISLLPDFYASRTPGLLKDIEDVVAGAEKARTAEEAAERARPADEPGAVSLASALRWVGRRVAAVHRLLASVIGLLPGQFEGCEAKVTSFRERLGVASVLVGLRETCANYLGVLAAPLGLIGRSDRPACPPRRRQQSMGPDPPPPSP